MENIIDIIFASYEIFLLVFIRVSGVFIFSPLFSSSNVPNIFKIGLSLCLSALLTTIVPFVDLRASFLPLIIFRELLVGVVIGYISYIFFTAFYVMGQIIDMKIGFGMVNVIDPQSRVQVPLTGNFYYIIAFMLLLNINGHHQIILALKDSFKTIPLGSFVMGDRSIGIIVDAMIKSFEIGFKLSSPIIAVIFLTDIILGVMARTIPQMNVFVVGMPLKLLVGLLVLLLGFPVFFGGVSNILDMIMNYIKMFLGQG